MAEEHEVLTTDKAADLLRVSTKAVLVLAREGTLPGEKIGRAWRFLRSDVLALVRGGSATKLMSESGGIVVPGGGRDD
ncbi:helix-turn-helix domain-containing protein [Dermabacter vaginalis]|uniref:helix-turn-helix domain-containing protein n=1 Tax=Dermabacter vaginalis TaxID=1630135 RepID=UPI0021A6D84D|nr:helix-turn-helix domain-containing protein [Dermabacter vaginalis]MCT2150649.1 helix-turn-helix domain-containing protein [Dermabacter vaginalis]